MVRGYLQIGGNLIQKNTNQMMNNVNVHQTDIEIAFGKFTESDFSTFCRILQKVKRCKPF